MKTFSSPEQRAEEPANRPLRPDGQLLARSLNLPTARSSLRFTSASVSVRPASIEEEEEEEEEEVSKDRKLKTR